MNIVTIVTAWEFWIALALVLIALDVMLGIGMVLLPFGLGAAVVGLFEAVFDSGGDSNWQVLTLLFVAFSVVFAGIVWAIARRMQRKSVTPDINTY